MDTDQLINLINGNATLHEEVKNLTLFCTPTSYTELDEAGYDILRLFRDRPDYLSGSHIDIEEVDFSRVAEAFAE